MSKDIVKLLPWRAQSGPQLAAIQKPWVPELLFGGARGGGKTAFLLGDFAQDVPTAAGPHWHGILFRRTYPQLEEVVKQSLDMYPRWFGKENVRWTEKDKTWRWKNGATLKLRFLEHETDWMEYQGHEYGWLGYDELTTWATPENYLRIKANLRSAHADVKYKRIRCSANPGGPGHEWVKEYFGIGRYPKGMVVLTPEDGSASSRMFIPSKVTDNRILLTADPDYINRLKGLGSPELVRAWLEGDWTVVQGAYFPEFSPDKHVVAPFEIPMDWPRIRAMDWGSAAPFAVYWAAIANENYVRPDGRVIPRGALVVYREWYGAKGANVGLKLDAEEVARGIAERTDLMERVTDMVIDPSAFAMNGGPSIAERMMRAVPDGTLSMRRGDNKRIPGWDALRQRLKGDGGVPMIYWFSTCQHLIRTMPGLQHDDTKMEDLETDGEDHAADATRYLCMMRPWLPPKQEPYKPRLTGYCLDELWEQREFGHR
jgi:hypothetical protein